MGGGAVTNFPDRVCDNKVSCKKPAHLDQKWPRNGCFKFSFCRDLFKGLIVPHAKEIKNLSKFVS